MTSRAQKTIEVKWLQSTHVFFCTRETQETKYKSAQTVGNNKNQMLCVINVYWYISKLTWNITMIILAPVLLQILVINIEQLNKNFLESKNIYANKKKLSA